MGLIEEVRGVVECVARGGGRKGRAGRGLVQGDVWWRRCFACSALNVLLHGEHVLPNSQQCSSRARARGSSTHATNHHPIPALPIMLEHALQVPTTPQRPPRKEFHAYSGCAWHRVACACLAMFRAVFSVPGAGCVGMMLSLFGVLQCVGLTSQLAAWRAASKPAGGAEARRNTEN